MQQNCNSCALEDASSIGGQNGDYTWYFNPDWRPAPGSDSVISMDASFPTDQTGWYSCKVENTVLDSLTIQSLPVYIEVDEGVKCGDTNLDTYYNMLDLALIGLNYGRTGPSRQATTLHVTTPEACFSWHESSLDPIFGDPGGYFGSAPLDYRLHGDTLNIKHADCNGDGRIDEGDLDCIRLYYDRPHTPPRYLENAMDPIQLLP